MKEGWICPRCGKVNAPFMMSCDCKPSTVSNFSDEGGCQHDWKYDIMPNADKAESEDII